MSRIMEGKYDDMLFSMLKECKTLPVFLDNIFGFLRRRTDFYHVTTEENSPVGLPAGFAEHVVKHAFFKWKPNEATILTEDQISRVLTEEQIPEPSDEVVIETSSNSLQNECTNLPKLGDKNINTKPETQGTFSSSECYNGSVYDNYSWSQSIVDVDITVKIPSNITTKDLKVNILSDKISVKLKEGTVLLEGELCQKCRNSDAIWSLEKGKLEIHLDKCREMWWDCLVTNEPRLDVQKLDCTRPFEELSDKAQAKIEELQWNQERKRLGLPTSDQLVLQERLKKAWNAEGSPFSGPFDPNTVIIN